MKFHNILVANLMGRDYEGDIGDGVRLISKWIFGE
jgi:hypothetical protein